MSALLERLAEGCRELGYEVKGDGTDAQMVETVLGMIRRNRDTQRRLCQRVNQLERARSEDAA